MGTQYRHNCSTKSNHSSHQDLVVIIKGVTGGDNLSVIGVYLEIIFFIKSNYNVSLNKNGTKQS